MVYEENERNYLDKTKLDVTSAKRSAPRCRACGGTEVSSPPTAVPGIKGTGPAGPEFMIVSLHFQTACAEAKENNSNNGGTGIFKAFPVSKPSGGSREQTNQTPS